MLKGLPHQWHLTAIPSFLSRTSLHFCEIQNTILPICDTIAINTNKLMNFGSSFFFSKRKQITKWASHLVGLEIQNVILTMHLTGFVVWWLIPSYSGVIQSCLTNTSGQPNVSNFSCISTDLVSSLSENASYNLPKTIQSLWDHSMCCYVHHILPFKNRLLWPAFQEASLPTTLDLPHHGNMKSFRGLRTIITKVTCYMKSV